MQWKDALLLLRKSRSSWRITSRLSQTKALESLQPFFHSLSSNLTYFYSESLATTIQALQQLLTQPIPRLIEYQPSGIPPLAQRIDQDGVTHPTKAKVLSTAPQLVDTLSRPPIVVDRNHQDPGAISYSSLPSSKWLSRQETRMRSPILLSSSYSSQDSLMKGPSPGMACLMIG